MKALMDALLGQSHQFVHSICDPDAIKWDFTGDLGKYTPCFIDLGCLAVGHGVAIMLYISWLYRLLSTRNARYDTFRLQGWYRPVHYSCLAAAAAAAAIPLFQLNARLAQQSLPLSAGTIAPHEWLGLLLAAVSFLLLSIVLLLELQNSFVLKGRWLIRLPLLLVSSSELVKLRFVLQLEVQQQEPLGYFFWLYVVYVGLQAYLAAVLCLMHWDPKSDNLLLLHEGEAQYMPLSSQQDAAAAAASVCPEYTAGILSVFTFSWLNPLMKKGYKTPLTATDIWLLPPPDRVETLEQRFRATWDHQLSTRGAKSASLFAACWSAVGHLFLAALPFKLVIDASQFVGPTILNRLLSVVAGRTTDSDSGGSWDGLWEHPLENGYVLAGLLFVGQLAGVLADHQHFQRVQRAGFRLKAVVTAEVYRKVLLLAPSERSHLSAGRLYNLVSSDANTLSDFCGNAFGFMSAPLRIIVTMVLLYRELGFSSMIAIVCIAAAVPINSKLVRAAANKLQTALKHSDARAKLESEMVAGIEVVKASTWEPAFKDRINAARAQELSVLYAVSMLQTLMGVLVMAIPTLIPVITFLAYLLIMKQPLSAAQAFTALSLFNILRFPLFQLPTIVSQATQARVALTRLRELLAAAEVQQTTLLPAAGQQTAAAAAANKGANQNGPAAPTPFAAVQPADSGSSSNSGGLPLQQQQPPDAASDVAISLHGDFSWDPDKAPALTDLNLIITKGQLVAVVGPTGSGKTSLISAMLGLLLGVSSDGSDPAYNLQGLKPGQQQPQQRQVLVNGRTAYVPQTPFILGASVRDNIIFGREWDAAKYAAATAAAQLLPDFAALPGGDMTELGDRGQNVSGGQKQRIAIARALYAEADVVLLDDPLSALDAKVGRAVAEHAIRQELADKTVVLATNQLQFVSMADLVVVMRDGAAAEVGTYPELLAAGGAFTALMKEAQAEDDLSSDSSGSSNGDEVAAAVAAAAVANSSTAAAAANSGQPAAAPTAPLPAAPAAAPASSGNSGKLTTEEASAVGGVSWAVVSAYFTALGGPVAVLLLMVGFITTELLRVGATVWLSVWTGETEAGREQHSSQFYMGIYAAISGGQLLLLYLNSLNVAASGIRAGRTLHEGLLSSLLRAPMSFFHTTPSGRIINRLTKDTADIDRNLASMLSFAFRACLQLCSTIILIAVGAPFALPALVVMLGVFYALYGYFMASMRQAKRLEAVSRSPVLSSVNEAIAGSATIRAFGIEGWLLNRQKALVNNNASNSLLTQSLNRWLSVRLEGLGALCTLMAALVTVEQQGRSAAAMGLLLTYALQITMSTNMTLRAGSMAEQTFNAVERVDEYCHLPAEAAYDQSDKDNKRDNKNNNNDNDRSTANDRGSSGSGGKKKKKDAGSGLREPLLPISHDDSSAAADAAAARDDGAAAAAAAFGTRGEIEFRDVNMRYRPGLPLVLCGLSFKVEAGFKIGVVGRTGAGKSSLIGALFRLTEIESGCISIDGVNTKTLGLRKLRSSMALIPQVPVIFAGSIRENLAPFGGHSDAALWSALRRSHLAPVVEKWESDGLGGLDYVLGEGGSPLSAGQKQLLALARALLNPAKILVLDEATANVDVETDALIQETLRSEFSERTLVAVAHRLHTIIEADRVLVMEKGKAVEYGTPASLLEDEHGHFTGMVRETGEATEKFLRNMAAGDISAHRELHDAAAAALVTICLPCDTDSPACLNTLASQLANGATAVNSQLSGLLQRLQTGDFTGSSAAAAAGSSKADRAGALQQLKAALAATSQLQQLALQAQSLVAGAAAGSSSSSSAEGCRNMLASVSEQLEQASLTGATDETPFTSTMSHLLVGSAPSNSFMMAPRRMRQVSSLPVRRFSHDDAAWGLRPSATVGAGFSGRRAHTASGAGSSGIDGTGGARIPRQRSLTDGSSSSGGLPGSSSVGGDGQTHQRSRYNMNRLSLDVPAAALAAAAAAARRNAVGGSSSGGSSRSQGA